MCKCFQATHPRTKTAHACCRLLLLPRRKPHSFEISKSRNGVHDDDDWLGAAALAQLSHIRTRAPIEHVVYIHHNVYMQTRSRTRKRHAHAKKCTFPFPAICASHSPQSDCCRRRRRCCCRCACCPQISSTWKSRASARACAKCAHTLCVRVAVRACVFLYVCVCVWVSGNAERWNMRRQIQRDIYICRIY